MDNLARNKYKHPLKKGKKNKTCETNNRPSPTAVPFDLLKKCVSLMLSRLTRKFERPPQILSPIFYHCKIISVFCFIGAGPHQHQECVSLQCTSTAPHQSVKTAPDAITKDPTDLSIFLRFFSSALSFWAEVRLSASARLSTAMAKKTFRRMTVFHLVKEMIAE